MSKADERIEDLKSKNKGAYITQGVSFNKDCPRQMELLKFAFEKSASFSGLIKELLALSLNGGSDDMRFLNNENVKNKAFQSNNHEKRKNVGNFI